LIGGVIGWLWWKMTGWVRSKGGKVWVRVGKGKDKKREVQVRIGGQVHEVPLEGACQKWDNCKEKKTEIARARHLGTELLSESVKPAGKPQAGAGGKPAQGNPPGTDKKRAAVAPASKVRDKAQELADLLEEIAGKCGVPCPGAGGKCFPRGSPYLEEFRCGGSESVARGIEEGRLGSRAWTLAEAERRGEPVPPRLQIDPAKSRAVYFVIRPEAEDEARVALLRPLSWISAEGWRAGGWTWLDLPDMGEHGPARVERIGPCPELAAGPGRLITGTYWHKRGWVGDLLVEGMTKPLGVTPSHPFWSVDRNDWVPAGELKIGERLLAADGSTPCVDSFTLRAEPEPVYNIEVEGDHCYRVGQQGLLVHNMSQSVNPPNESSQAKEPCPESRADRFRRIFKKINNPPSIPFSAVEGKSWQEIIALLPTFGEIDNKTWGILVVGNTAFGIWSGETDDTTKFKTLRFRKGLLSPLGNDLYNTNAVFVELGDHVEMEVAALFWKHGYQTGILYINATNPCYTDTTKDKLLSCWNDLDSVLPKGASLTVFGTNEKRHRTFKGTV
jgi:hypothetical protein